MAEPQNQNNGSQDGKDDPEKQMEGAEAAQDDNQSDASSEKSSQSSKVSSQDAQYLEDILDQEVLDPTPIFHVVPIDTPIVPTVAFTPPQRPIVVQNDRIHALRDLQEGFGNSDRAAPPFLDSALDEAEANAVHLPEGAAAAEQHDDEKTDVEEEP